MRLRTHSATTAASGVVAACLLLAPAIGYRIDFDGRSVVVSGDTIRSANVEAVDGMHIALPASSDERMIETF